MRNHALYKWCFCLIAWMMTMCAWTENIDNVKVIRTYKSNVHRTIQCERVYSTGAYSSISTYNYSIDIAGAEIEEYEGSETDMRDNEDKTSTQTIIHYRAKVKNGAKVHVSFALTGVSGLHRNAGYKVQFGLPYGTINNNNTSKAIVTMRGEGYPSGEHTYILNQTEDRARKGYSDHCQISIKAEPYGYDADNWGQNQVKGPLVVNGQNVVGYNRELAIFLDITVVPETANTSTTGTDPIPDIPTPPHVEEHHDAWPLKNVWQFAIPASVIIGMMGYTLTMGKRKKGEDDEDPKHPDPREMHIYKDFGDTLIVGDAPKQVFAKTVRKMKGDKVVPDSAMTALIQITPGDDYMQVEDGGVQGEWRTAWIAAPEVVEGMEPPEEAVVTFRMGNDGGSYTNHLHFKVSTGEIRFKQDNLTLPARYEKEVRLPFEVIGINDGTADIKATILDIRGNETKDYSIKTEWSKKDNCYYAVIRDLISDPKKDEGIAGNYLGYAISIEARRRNNSPLVIKGALPLYRYYMGLVMRMRGDVHCFLEEYDPMRHISNYMVRKDDGKDYVPAQQNCYLKLYDYDEKKNELYIIDPNPKTVKWKWTVKDIAEQGGAQKVMNDILGRETMQTGLDIALAGAGLGSAIGTLVSEAHSKVFEKYNLSQQRLLQFQQQLNDLGLSFQARWQTAGEGYMYYVLQCTKGVLNAPNRFDAELEVIAEHKGKTYSFKRTVHILSQPKRDLDYPEMKAALAHDDEILEGLQYIESEVTCAHLTKRLAPLLYFIRLQIDFYHEDYGYDERNINAIRDTYMHFIEHEADEAGVKAKEATACDNLKWYNLDWWLETSFEGRAYLHDMHWAARIGVAVASMGFAEIVYEVPYQMKKYIDEGGESTVGAFCVGAKVAVEAYVSEQIIGGVIGAGKVIYKGGKAGVSEIFSGMKQALNQGSIEGGGMVAKDVLAKGLEALKETMKSEAATGLKTWLKKQITWETGVLEKALASEAKAWWQGFSGNFVKGSKYTAAEKLARAQAIENIEHLQTMRELVKWNPTPENVRMMNQLIMRCQADKQTMIFLKNTQLLRDVPLLKGVNFTALRQDFNNLLQNIYNETDELVKGDLAISANISASKIKVLGASTSKTDDLLKGLSITFDRDVTYYYIVNKKPVYFNQVYVESLYAQHFRNLVNSKTLQPRLTNFNPAELTEDALKRLQAKEAQQAAIAARLYDQTVIEDILGHPESYGDDLDRMIKQKFWGDALKNPAKVSEAILHKGTGRFDYADALWQQAGAANNTLNRRLLEAQAVSEMMEGCRQVTKVFDLLMARDAVRNTIPKISKELSDAVDILRPLNGVDATLSQVEAKLAEAGYTFHSIAKAVSNAVYKVA